MLTAEPNPTAATFSQPEGTLCPGTERVYFLYTWHCPEVVYNNLGALAMLPHRYQKTSPFPGQKRPSDLFMLLSFLPLVINKILKTYI